jgi:hypothetical protein
MSENHSTTATNPGKPAKPYPEFALTAHPARYWFKKLRGKLDYFGPWDDSDGALSRLSSGLSAQFGQLKLVR